MYMYMNTWTKLSRKKREIEMEQQRLRDIQSPKVGRKETGRPSCFTSCAGREETEQSPRAFNEQTDKTGNSGEISPALHAHTPSPYSLIPPKICLSSAII
ncbi:hypothetical protein BKA81DRAFT_348896 [Phyllosticta paracitricarpa]